MLMLVGVFSLILIAGGFVLLHLAYLRRARLLHAAGWTLLLGGLLHVGFLVHLEMRSPPPPMMRGQTLTPGQNKMMIEAPPPPAGAQAPAASPKKAPKP